MPNFNTSNRFDQLEMIGRVAITELYKNLDVKYTQTFENYDAWLDISKSPNKKHLIWFEIKIRNANYDTYVIESAKLNLLFKKRNDFLANNDAKIDIMYLNFTPNGTYIWNLDDVVNKYDEKTIYAGKYTAKQSNKILKKAYYLPVYDAVNKYNYIIDINRIRTMLQHKSL